MSSDFQRSHRRRFDQPSMPTAVGPNFQLPVDWSGPGGCLADSPFITSSDIPLTEGIERAGKALISRQNPEGYWVGELEGDTILESEYILLLTYLKREHSEEARLAANYMLQKQLPEGGWAIYPGGPLEISASVKAYWALKIVGHDPEEECMVRARQAILKAGGAEKVNSFTRYYFALLGLIPYSKCPAIPPELMFLPHWMPFNIYEMSSWSRTILVPLSILWTYQPFRQLPPHLHIPEVFQNDPRDLPLCMPPSEALDELTRPARINWTLVFSWIDRGIKLGEKLRINPVRGLAVKRATEWMLERFEKSDGLGAIFPPIIWSIVALKCRGYSEDSREVRMALTELEKLSIREGDTLRLQPCKSPVWDTAIASLALREAELSPEHPALKKSISWLLSKEVRDKGDWTVRNRQQEPAGWFFEFNNEFYPDIDDTSMVVMALCRTLPRGGADREWIAEYLLGKWSPHQEDDHAAAVLSTTGAHAATATRELSTVQPRILAAWRGAKWILTMQNRDGGWGAFDRDNDREIYTRVPFADHNAMIDPSTVDLAGRMLEMLADLNVSENHPAVRKALEFIWARQEKDHCWYGRWGVNYLYGTWQVLVGLTRIGIPTSDPRIVAAARWIKDKQQPCGGWGETPETYDNPSLRGSGVPTPSQTAWALMGLLAAGEVHSEATRRGVEYLLKTQRDDGDWDEETYTGTGFPKVFYLRYHLYRLYFPLMALARYARMLKQ